MSNSIVWFKRDLRIVDHAALYAAALYWDFHGKHADKLSTNPRIGMVYQQLKKNGSRKY